jgi:5-dehydro-2-deoxygluconokinase
MSYDLITLGRVGLDLYSMNIGAPFVEIEAFDTAVGGSPTNIAIGSSRLGLRTAALTAVGDEPIGDFVLNFLNKEGVDTQYIPRIPGTRTGMAVVGIEPPDRFPLVFYRENPADIYVSIQHIMAVPIAESRALQISGTALSRGACRDTALYAAEVGRTAKTTVFVDLDLRVDQWEHPRSFGLNVRTVFPAADVIIGTEEEFYAALAKDPEPVMANQPLTGAMRSELKTALADQVVHQPDTVLVLKRGERGVSIYVRDQIHDVEGFPVEIINTIGAGDAFASGLIYGYTQGWEWERIGRFANACGAIVVTRHGCAKAMPFLDEVTAFICTRD